MFHVKQKPRLPRAIVIAVWALGYAASVGAFAGLCCLMGVPR